MVETLTAQKSILIVDNDRFLQEAIGDLLTREGYRVRKAIDGLQALEEAGQEPPDFILLDLIMPKIDGVRVCRYLREDPHLRGIPVIIFSGLAARDIAEMSDLEADAYVAKGPLNIVASNILAALRHLESRGRSTPLQEAIFGYEGFRPRQLVTELMALKRHHELLLWNMREGVLEVDEGGRIVYANPAALQMLKTSEKGLIGAELITAFDPAHREEIERIATQLLAASKPGKRLLSVRDKGKLLRLSISNLPGKGGETGLLILMEAIEEA